METARVEPAPVEAARVGGGPVHGAPAGSAGQNGFVDGLVGGQVPEETLERLLTGLAAQSQPVLPSRALALTARSWQIALAIGGASALVLLLVGVPALLDRLL